MATLNAIPSLISFSGLGFSTKGFLVEHGSMQIEEKKSLLNFKDIKLIGKSANIRGNGYINLDNNSTEFNLNVTLFKTIGEGISDIGLGYILFGDDRSFATTIKATGDINDPKIYSEIFKDILYAPFNIIKRVINIGDD